MGLRRMIDGFKPLESPDYLRDCRMNSLLELLRFYKIPVSKNDVLLLSECFSFLFGTIQLGFVGNLNIPLAVASKNFPEETVLNALGFKVTKGCYDGTNKSWQRIKKLLDSNIPVMIHCDERVLSGDQNKKEHLNIHFLSSPVLLGYDDETDSFLAFWTNTNQYLFPVQIKRKVILNNCLKECIPSSANGVYLYVDTPRIISSEDLISNEHSAIYNTAAYMLSKGSAVASGTERIQNKPSAIGIAAFQEMVNYLNYLKKMSFFHMYSNEYRKKIQLMALVLRTCLLNGSFSAFRSEYGEALIDFGCRTNSECLIAAGKEFIEVSKTWKKALYIISQLSKAQISWVKIANLLRLFRKICCAEESIYKDIKNYYEKNTV